MNPICDICKEEIEDNELYPLGDDWLCIECFEENTE